MRKQDKPDSTMTTQNWTMTTQNWTMTTQNWTMTTQNSTMPNRFTKHPRPSQKRSEVDTPICEYEYCRSHRTFLMAGVGTAQCLPRVSRIRSVRSDIVSRALQAILDRIVLTQSLCGTILKAFLKKGSDLHGKT